MLPKVMTLYEYQKQAVKCDIQLLKCSKEGKWNAPSNQTFPPSAPATSSSTQGYDTMGIGVTCISNASKSGPRGP
jgi:hypothetical protein